MAKFKVLALSYIGNSLVQPGAVVELDFSNGGQPGENLEPLDKPVPPAARDAISDLVG